MATLTAWRIPSPATYSDGSSQRLSAAAGGSVNCSGVRASRPRKIQNEWFSGILFVSSQVQKIGQFFLHLFHRQAFFAGKQAIDERVRVAPGAGVITDPILHVLALDAGQRFQASDGAALAVQFRG